MGLLTKFSLGSALSLLIFAGWQHIKVLNLEKDLIVITESRDKWKASDGKLRLKVTEIEQAAELADDLNEAHLKTIKQSQENYLALQEELKDANQRYQELSNIFAEHDFEYLLKAKPGLMQRVIRNGTKKVFESFVPEEFITN